MQASCAALVVGATGVTGTPLVEQLLERGWHVFAVSRRSPLLRPGLDTAKLTHIALDIADLAQARAGFASLSAVTHLYYCANDSLAERRLQMLGNVLDALEPAAAQLANVHLMQGSKYYGCHLGAFKVPARETDPRVAGADFYYSEEDFVRRRSESKRWTWTALRPHSVCGYTAGNPLNLVAVIGIYAALCKALGEPLVFPSNAACYDAQFNVCDADLLAQAAIWCSTTAQCGNHAFNVNNGDVFRWRELWPSIAEFFALPAAGPRDRHLPEFLQAHAGLWQRISERHGLKAFPYERVAGWVQGDYALPNSRFACAYDVMSDLGKARSFGFVQRVDSTRMFLRLFQRLRDERVIP